MSSTHQIKHHSILSYFEGYELRKNSIYVLAEAVFFFFGPLVILSTASIPILRNTSITNNNLNETGISASPKDDDSFFQRLKQLFTKEVIDIDISDKANINSSKIKSSVMDPMDNTTDNISYNENPQYPENNGFILNISSNISSRFSLIEVTAKGRKAPLIINEIQDEPPVIVHPP